MVLRVICKTKIYIPEIFFPFSMLYCESVYANRACVTMTTLCD